MSKATEEQYQEALKRAKEKGIVRDENSETSFRRGWCIPAGDSKPRATKPRPKRGPTKNSQKKPVKKTTRKTKAKPAAKRKTLAQIQAEMRSK